MESGEATGAILKLIGAFIGDPTDSERVVIENVNWTVSAGDYWVVGGLHGSGKSSLLGTLAGIMPVLAGEYWLFDENLAAPSNLEHSPARQRLGLVFDGGRLLHDLTVFENVALPLRYHTNLSLEDSAAQVADLLDITGLEPMATRFPGTLGRNWQQRAGLARALVLKPEVLLLDNALTGLDPREAHWWLEFLNQLCCGHCRLGNKPMTLIVTADDLRPWRDRAGRFAILKNRQLLVLGNQQELEAHREPLLEELLPAFSRRN